VYGEGGEGGKGEQEGEGRVRQAVVSEGDRGEGRKRVKSGQCWRASAALHRVTLPVKVMQMREQ
jgi:hypothetical protein